MSRIKIISMLAVALVAIAVSMPAFAHGGHHHHHRGVSVGFVFGGPAFYYPPYYYPPYYYPPYYYPPYYYYPRVVTVPAAPVYVERGDSYAPSAQTQGYWHYCPEAKAYYPYVKHCVGGWQKHTPTPPPGG